MEAGFCEYLDYWNMSSIALRLHLDAIMGNQAIECKELGVVSNSDASFKKIYRPDDSILVFFGVIDWFILWIHMSRICQNFSQLIALLKLFAALWDKEV